MSHSFSPTNMASTESPPCKLILRDFPRFCLIFELENVHVIIFFLMENDFCRIPVFVGSIMETTPLSEEGSYELY